jgi:CDP-glucose 4,6-dehydratase
MLDRSYRDKRVLITGHTGFKGAWLAEWLLKLGAKVTGFSLPSPTRPSLFEQLELERRMCHVIGDMRDANAVREVVTETRPDFIFHLAAQSLVRQSYLEPADTYAVNVMGTVHLLDAARQLEKRCSIVAVTSDKCYENREWLYGYREEDPLGGHDPYSASKGAAELVVASYRRSFFSSAESPVRIASARAGNVIGGGDWAPNRIVPDCVRALRIGDPIKVRNRISTRPWQHVLEPLSGYLLLGSRLASSTGAKPVVASAFNFGPDSESNRSVADLVDVVLKHWPGKLEDHSDPQAVHEAGLLNLATEKARQLLGWKPVWTFTETVARTIDWYRQNLDVDTNMATLTGKQIEDYCNRSAGVLGIAHT